MPFSHAEEIRLPFDPSELVPAPAGPLGPALRAARELSRRSLEEVSQVTRIGTHYLAALEEVRLEDFAGRVYAIGFARSYARELGLPDDWAQARMCEEIERHQPRWRRSASIIDFQVETATP